ncbi:hypothetical protein [Mycolicibacterium fortuitum]|uniref:Uncharacterized protein n=2 Tax=Mycolicibacterium fortuitum TaxID=1766 RepID=A0AAE4VGJ5_MYCFO|nr:hypothetical protein [Mycolicibacterium fortuitum]MCV7137900.1 hypothetical protein [Mycolicibacterium fortuitum]MDV7195392.1 hypothetical protein [Mycolicibacterium fortuitum]MDV7207912.1 hypothetical protein [Mycolicibacterium fortuitum]MDV7229210.1 hypothetical protein [Mycolicibacterium fortuitum]MDV7260909.1 hypothetical protein [Mycolicibacterium fortuitum]
MLQTAVVTGGLYLADIEPVHNNNGASTPAPNLPQLTDSGPTRLYPQPEPPALEPMQMRPTSAGPMTAESMCAHRQRRHATGSMWRKR